MPGPGLDRFLELIAAARARSAAPRTLIIPLSIRLLDDQLTPVLAYRRLVAPDDRAAPSFLLESVENGSLGPDGLLTGRQGRHSILGAQPALEVIARRNHVIIDDHRCPLGGPPATPTFPQRRTLEETDPLSVVRRLTANALFLRPPAGSGLPPLPRCFVGGWVGYAAYDAVRYAAPGKLPFDAAPPDDRNLPDVHFACYDGAVVFDHVEKTVHVIRTVEVPAGSSREDSESRYRIALDALERRVTEIQTHVRPLESGRLPPPAPSPDPAPPLASNTTRARHADMVRRALSYIAAGDVFQVVLGQRFQKSSPADPFDVYRALRAVNPSPYMVYLQARDCILVASSPEILCRVRTDPASGLRTLTNRPLAGTRRRAADPAQDAALAAELLADPKERAEHIMLVDLGRNDVGIVARPGSVRLDRLMEIERYSHVMHISSTVTGDLRDGLDAWDALRACLPVGTISGAPKIRAMQIIDELEPCRRGPYGGGIGYVGFDGDMDIALALRTIVVPTAGLQRADPAPPGGWQYHIQASGGIVADSIADAEYTETVNKAAALARAIEVAEYAFPDRPPRPAE